MGERGAGGGETHRETGAQKVKRLGQGHRAVEAELGLGLGARFPDLSSAVNVPEASGSDKDTLVRSCCDPGCGLGCRGVA